MLELIFLFFVGILLRIGEFILKYMKEKENEKREREREWGEKKNIEEKVLNGDFVDNVLVVLICD